LAGLRLRSPHARAHVHPASTQTPRAHNCGSRARLLLLLLLLLLSLACSSCFCCCCSTHPPWRTPTSRGHIRARGGSNPVVPSFVCRHAHATSERAISPLPGLGQTIRSSLSASGAGDAQGTAKHGQQAKDSRTTRTARLRNVRQRAPIRPRGGGRHKGACEGGERDWDGVFCSSPVSPGPWATPRRSAASSATKTRRLSATDSRRRPRFAPGSSGKEE
jgi:hypothetical protein